MVQVVDTETAKEFMKETLDKVDRAELSEICTEVEEKSAGFRQALAPGSIDTLSADDIRTLLKQVFSVRRRSDALLETYGTDALRSWILDLLYGEEETCARFERFCGRVESLEGSHRHDLASELLHFTEPQKFWLWTRWMWDPRTRTGALPLVTTAAYDLAGETFGETYLKVGKAVAFVHEVGDAAGFQTIQKTIFGTDVFLSCVYVIYSYTVLRMRMTQEFNRVMPELPEFSRRLLGVYRGSKERGAEGGRGG